jgi:hypothetical protein
MYSGFYASNKQYGRPPKTVRNVKNNATLYGQFKNR